MDSERKLPPSYTHNKEDNYTTVTSPSTWKPPWRTSLSMSNIHKATSTTGQFHIVMSGGVDLTPPWRRKVREHSPQNKLESHQSKSVNQVNLLVPVPYSSAGESPSFGRENLSWAPVRFNPKIGHKICGRPNLVVPPMIQTIPKQESGEFLPYFLSKSNQKSQPGNLSSEPILQCSQAVTSETGASSEHISTSVKNEALVNSVSVKKSALSGEFEKPHSRTTIMENGNRAVYDFNFESQSTKNSNGSNLSYPFGMRNGCKNVSTSFRNAFTASQVTQLQKNEENKTYSDSYHCLPNNSVSNPVWNPHSPVRFTITDVKSPEKSFEVKKNKKGIFGGFFKWRKKEDDSSSISSSSSESDETSNRNNFFKKRKGKNSGKGPMQENNFQTKVLVKNPFELTTLKSSLLRIPNKQPLGIPLVASKPLMDQNISYSYDQLHLNKNNTTLLRCSSSDGISKRGKKDLVKARIEKIRESIHDSSSEDEKNSILCNSQFGSQGSINKTSPGRRTRSARTDRYLRRKSQELESLQIEKEKDRRSKEIVQARIQEIQIAQRKKLEKDTLKESSHAKRFWSANLVYQQSNEFEASVTLPTPTSSTCATTLVNSNSSFLLSPQAYSRRSYQEDKGYFNFRLNKSRSISCENNINDNYAVIQAPKLYSPHCEVTHSKSKSNVPPLPPPRDKSKFTSPGGISRPVSFSLDAEPTSDIGSLISNSSQNTFSYRGFADDTESVNPTPVPARRSFSELNLFPINVYKAIPCQINQPQHCLDKHLSVQNFQNNIPYYVPQKVVSDHLTQNSKAIPVSSIPPSPSSDYSSYVSDSSIRNQQAASSLWKVKESENFIKVSSSVENSHHVSNMSRGNSPCMKTKIKEKNVVSTTLQSPKNVFVNSSILKTDSVYSVSGNKEVVSPTPKRHEKGADSDSNQGTLTKDKKKCTAIRPLSMVTENLEAADYSTASSTKNIPNPPKRNNENFANISLEMAKRQMEVILYMSCNKSDATNERQKMFEKAYLKEREKLEKSKCINFEEALKELEEIYNSLKLDSEDIMEGAERRDRLQHNFLSESSPNEHNLNQPLQINKFHCPDKTRDDMHYRRCNKADINQGDLQKQTFLSGSYLLTSAVHSSSLELDKKLQKDPIFIGEPDPVYDDVSYRNIQKANSIRIIDPQPLFGIPLGPVIGSNSNNYLDITPKENYRPLLISRKTPDISMDDLAFRNLRREAKGLIHKDSDDDCAEAKTLSCGIQENKSSNVISLEGNRNIENDIYVIADDVPNTINNIELISRGHDDYIINGKLTNNKKCWLLKKPSHTLKKSSDNGVMMEENISSAHAVSQPDIRQAIIREARAPSGGPLDVNTNAISKINQAILTGLKVQSAPTSPIIGDRKQYRPLDAIFNSKPKPFYMCSDTKAISQDNCQITKGFVDIAKLDALISALSQIDKSSSEKSVEESNAKDNINVKKEASKRAQNILASNDTDATNHKEYKPNETDTMTGKSISRVNVENSGLSHSFSSISPTFNFYPSVVSSKISLHNSKPSLTVVSSFVLPEPIKADICTTNVEIITINSEDIKPALQNIASIKECDLLVPKLSAISFEPYIGQTAPSNISKDSCKSVSSTEVDSVNAKKCLQRDCLHTQMSDAFVNLGVLLPGKQSHQRSSSLPSSLCACIRKLKGRSHSTTEDLRMKTSGEKIFYLLDTEKEVSLKKIANPLRITCSNTDLSKSPLHHTDKEETLKNVSEFSGIESNNRLCKSTCDTNEEKSLHLAEPSEINVNNDLYEPPLLYTNKEKSLRHTVRHSGTACSNNAICDGLDEQSRKSRSNMSTGEDDDHCHRERTIDIWRRCIPVACYILACVIQLAGLDLLEAFSLILAVASIFVIFVR